MTDRPFHSIGFECNPFRALTREEWVRAAVLPEEVHRAVNEGGHIQILGQTGSGKTTALLALVDEFQRAGRKCGYENIPRGSNRFLTKTEGLEIFLLDEAQRLSDKILIWGRERERLSGAAQKGIRLILGTHEELAGIFREAGVSFQTIRLESPNREALTTILERRLTLFAIRDDRAKLSDESVEWLRENFGGGLRRMEYFLYDFFQTARPTGSIPPDALRKALKSFTPPAVEPE